MKVLEVIKLTFCRLYNSDFLVDFFSFQNGRCSVLTEILDKELFKCPLFKPSETLRLWRDATEDCNKSQISGGGFGGLTKGTQGWKVGSGT